MPKRTRRQPTVLSAFTGAGGLDLGLERAGFRTIACIELDRNARETVRRNRPAWCSVMPTDIIEAAADLTPRKLGLRVGELGVLSGGPPCQPFSTAGQWVNGHRSGLDDRRSLTLLAFLELARRFRPQVVLIENVPGFVQGRTSALPIIEAEFKAINRRYGTKYRVSWQIIRASDYGVPQRRKRAIIIVRRDGVEMRWPAATHAASPARAYDALWNVRAKDAPGAKGPWAELLPSIPAGSNYQYHTKPGGGVHLFGHRAWFWSFLLKLAPDAPAWTIPAQAGPATGPFHWQNRPLTSAECARLQTFPRSWQFAGGVTAQKRQIGNATPPLLAEVIGRALARDVFHRHPRGRASLLIPRRRTVPKPPRPRPVPAKYLGRKTTQADHPGVGAGPGARRRRLALLEQLAQLVTGLIETRRLRQRRHSEAESPEQLLERPRLQDRAGRQVPTPESRSSRHVGASV